MRQYEGATLNFIREHRAERRHSRKRVAPFTERTGIPAQHRHAGAVALVQKGPGTGQRRSTTRNLTQTR